MLQIYNIFLICKLNHHFFHRLKLHRLRFSEGRTAKWIQMTSQRAWHRVIFWNPTFFVQKSAKKGNFSWFSLIFKRLISHRAWHRVIYLLPPQLEVTIWHLKISSCATSNIKSSPSNLSIFRRTWRFNWLVSIPYACARSKSSITRWPRISYILLCVMQNLAFLQSCNLARYASVVVKRCLIII